MMRKLVPGLLLAIFLGGCSGGTDIPADQSMDSQLKGLKNGPMGDKNGSKGGVTKVGSTPGAPTAPSTSP